MIRSLTIRWDRRRGHLIHVTTTASGSAKLFIDDDCADTTNDLFAVGDASALIGFFGENHEFAVDVYIKPPETPLVEEFAGGDRLNYAVAFD